MVVLILERAPASLRGELSRWMIEPRAGVFVGRVSAMVREKLWIKAVEGAKGHGLMMLFSSQSEQGFSVRTHGDTSRSLVALDGLTLVRIPMKKRENAAAQAKGGGSGSRGAGKVQDPFEPTPRPRDPPLDTEEEDARE